MDRSRCRAQRGVVLGPRTSALPVRPGKGRSGIDEGIPRSKFTKRHHSDRGPGNLSAGRQAGELRRGSVVGRQHSSSAFGIPLSVYSWNRDYSVLRPRADVFGRQHEEEKYSHAFRYAPVRLYFIVYFDHLLNCVLQKVDAKLESVFPETNR